MNIEQEQFAETVKNASLSEADTSEYFTSADKIELSYLEKLQTSGNIEGTTWNQEHSARLKQLREKKSEGPKEADIARFNELTRMQTTNKDWTPELAKEISDLYQLMEHRKLR